jgi:hypothetical protein
MTGCLVVLCGVKKKREQCPTFQSRQKILSNTFPLPIDHRSVNESLSKALWKTGKWSKIYILSISGSLKAVQDLTNSKLPQKNACQPEKCPPSRHFSKVLSGNYWHLQRLSSIEAPLNGRFSDKGVFFPFAVRFLSHAAETFYVGGN